MNDIITMPVGLILVLALFVVGLGYLEDYALNKQAVIDGGDDTYIHYSAYRNHTVLQMRDECFEIESSINSSRYYLCEGRERGKFK